MLARTVSIPILSVAMATLFGLCVPGASGQSGEGRPPHEIQLTNPFFKPWPAGTPTPRSWGELPDGRQWGSTSAVHVDRDGSSMWVFERCGADHGDCVGGFDVDPILKFDSDGNLLTSFGAGMFIFPHGLHVDRDGNLWATDARAARAQQIEEFPEAEGIGHQVTKFSPEGEVLMTLGTAGVAGDPPHALTEPNATVTAANGDIFIAESHSGNTVNRISKFAADGTFLMSWGRSGSGPGEFNVPHDIAIDSQGRIFVADRLNYRIQIFDQDGGFIDSWKQFGQPSGIYISPDDILYVTDSHSWGDDPRLDNEPYRKGIRIGSARTGEVYHYIPDIEAMTRANSGAEGIGADADGNVYAAIVRRLGVEKHVLPENE